MSYFVLCSFDLKNATSKNYEDAYSDLKSIGLSRTLTGTNRPVTLPTTLVGGSYDGANASSIRDDLFKKIQQIFLKRGFKSEIFLSVGGQDWTWNAGTT